MTQSLLLWIVEYRMTVFIVVLLVVQAVAKEVGYWFGQRRAVAGDVPGEGVGVIVGGMLEPLAFVLALILYISSARSGRCFARCRLCGSVP